MSKDKIPTAAALFQANSLEFRGGYSKQWAVEKMQEFAKFHVEAALKAAQAKCRELFEGTTFLESDIGKAYPLDNIK